MNADNSSPSAGRIFPSWEQIAALRQPLTEGETALADYLDKNLPSDWEIFVQPYMNGDRPDIVILSKSHGLMIFEVKDWNPVHYTVQQVPIIDKKTRESVLDKNEKPKTRRQYVVKDSPSLPM